MGSPRLRRPGALAPAGCAGPRRALHKDDGRVRSGDQSRRATDRVDQCDPAARTPILPSLPGRVRSPSRHGRVTVRLPWPRRQPHRRRGLRKKRPRRAGASSCGRGRATSCGRTRRRRPGPMVRQACSSTAERGSTGAVLTPNVVCLSQRPVCQPTLLLDHPCPRPGRRPRLRLARGPPLGKPPGRRSPRTWRQIWQLRGHTVKMSVRSSSALSFPGDPVPAALPIHATGLKALLGRLGIPCGDPCLGRRCGHALPMRRLRMAARRASSMRAGSARRDTARG
jgi:hypothetical protein